MRLLCLCLFLLYLSACRRDSLSLVPDDPSGQQYAYFPLQIGHWLEYRVDSLVYDTDPAGQIAVDTVSCRVREQMTDTFRNTGGELVYRVERQVRKSEAEPWRLDRVWSASRNSSEAIRTEENLRFLKLIFPLRRLSTWNGNLYLDESLEIEVAGEKIQPFQNWRYQVADLDIPGTVGSFAFDSLLYIIEADETNIIERRYSAAVYAKNLGLVYKEQWILDSQYCNQIPPPPDCETRPWEFKAEKGFILRQTLINHP